MVLKISLQEGQRQFAEAVKGQKTIAWIELKLASKTVPGFTTGSTGRKSASAGLATKVEGRRSRIEPPTSRLWARTTGWGK